jgi:ATP-dependent helicase HrpB
MLPGSARFDPHDALRAWVGWQGMAQVDRLAPEHWETPLGRRLAIDYAGDAPEIAVRLQEVLGETTHPVVGPERQPIRIVLLSPAERPIQVTMDLPGFWAGSYADVRKDMRARYPRHVWPEDPTAADPTLRAKREGNLSHSRCRGASSPMPRAAAAPRARGMHALRRIEADLPRGAAKMNSRP